MILDDLSIFAGKK